MTKIGKATVTNEEQLPSSLIGYAGNWLIHPDKIKSLEGRLLTLIEAAGLRETQEKSLKDIIRNEIWRIIEDGLWVEGTDVTRLHQEYEKAVKEGRGVSVGSYQRGN